MQGLGDLWGLFRKEDKERFKFSGVNLCISFYKVGLDSKIICSRFMVKL